MPDENLIGMSPERAAHSLAVGKLARKVALEQFSLDRQTAQALFFLGYVHDIGYELSERQEDHETTGGLFLKELGFDHWKEVRYHGMPESPYTSPLLDILNYADLSIDARGNRIAIVDRIADIGKRYGTQSQQYAKAVSLSEELRKKGFSII